jgi:hypothetical protein
MLLFYVVKRKAIGYPATFYGLFSTLKNDY